MSFSLCWGCGGPLGGHFHFRDAWHPGCRPGPPARVVVRKKAGAWTFEVRVRGSIAASGRNIPTQQEALVAGLGVLGWIESGRS